MKINLFINNNARIVDAWDDGSVDECGQPLAHGFLLYNGTFTSLDSPYAGVVSNWPLGINDKGLIVGQTIDANDFFLGFEAQPAK